MAIPSNNSSCVICADNSHEYFCHLPHEAAIGKAPAWIHGICQPCSQEVGQKKTSKYALRCTLCNTLFDKHITLSPDTQKILTVQDISQAQEKLMKRANIIILGENFAEVVSVSVGEGGGVGVGLGVVAAIGSYAGTAAVTGGIVAGAAVVLVGYLACYLGACKMGAAGKILGGFFTEKALDGLETLDLLSTRINNLWTQKLIDWKLVPDQNFQIN